MTSEAVKLAKIARQTKRDEQLFKILANPVVELIAGVTAIEALYMNGAFGKVGEVGTTTQVSTTSQGSLPWSLLVPGSGASTTTKSVTITDKDIEMARKVRDHTKTALYVILVAQALSPSLPMIAGLGETAIKTVGGFAKPAVPMITSALGGV